jgi:subtilase family serine protease
MSRAVRHLAAAGALVVVFGSAGLAPRLDASPSRPHPRAQRRVGNMDPSHKLSFNIDLRLPHPGAVRHFLDAASDPASAAFGRTLGAARFGRRFGLGNPALGRVRRLLEEAGLRVERWFPQRTTIEVRGTVARINDLFHTRIARYVDAEGYRYHGPATEPVIPRRLDRQVLAVSGLSTQRSLRPADVPAGGLKGPDVLEAYDGMALRDLGYDGAGETVAIISFDSFEDSDVAVYDQAAGIDGPPVEHVPVQGGTPIGDGEVEVNLDIDIIRGIAPQAQVLNYEMRNGTRIGVVVDEIVGDGRADIVNLSWGTCDDPHYLRPRSRRADTQSFAAAVAQGINIFEASGDKGAFCGEANDLSDHRLLGDWPSASADIISVGGTLLSVRDDGSYLEESGWEDVLSGTGGGGGLTNSPRPEWQSAPGVDNEFSNGSRQFPDVAAAADPDSGFAFAVDGELTASGGTSAAAPFWAGSMVLIKQYAQDKGIDSLGYLNPAFYYLASHEQPFEPFHDVVRGGNRHYDAGPGWDYSTGLGTPDLFNLARDLVAYLKQSSPGG